MKICPRCQKTYADDNLNFCLEDGSVLSQMTAQPPQTVVQEQPRITQPQPQMVSQPGAQPGWNAPPQQQYSLQPQKKSSKTWLWVLLILGVLVLVCGGGFAAFFFWAASQADKAANFNTYSNNSSTNNNNRTVNTNTTSTSGRTDVDKLDLEPWVPKVSLYGNTEYVGDELMIASKQKRYYYVLAGTKDQTTENADTIVTLRNVDNADSSLGYGLVFHSNPTPLQQGYAFLIDTKKKKYRVVHHLPQEELNVVNWTKSDAIKDGVQSNTLEVHDNPDKIELFINGQLVNSIKNVYGYSGGVVGLYSGDAAKIAFKNLEIRR